VPYWVWELRHERSLRWLGVACLAGAAAAVMAGLALLAYELTAARVPEHRAALERLVRAETGLDLRFQELGLRWGWYGPEAVFSRVELGEPGRAHVLLRAPELIVGFDAWRTVQSGHMQAGRITLVAPDIDLPPAAPRTQRAHASASTPDPASAATILGGWRGGRIDFEGGTLRLADPHDPTQHWAVSIRRASLYRAREAWGAQAFVLLPERLGATAHFKVDVRGDLQRPASLAGTVNAEGVRLVFAGWRDLLQATPQLAQLLPAAGGGDLTVRAEFRGGRLQQAQGSVHAGGVEIADPLRADHPLLVDRVRGDWRLRRAAAAWHADIDSFQMGRSQSDAAPAAHVTIDWQDARLQLRASRLPLESLAAAIGWAAPQLDVAGTQIGGTAHAVAVDWDGTRPHGARLWVRAHLDNIAVAPATHAFALSGLSAQVAGDERAWSIDSESDAARLELGPLPEDALPELHLAAHLALSRTAFGWRLTSDELSIEQRGGPRVRMSGSVSGLTGQRAPIFDLRGSVTNADVALLQRLAAAQLLAHFGPAAAHAQAGRITDAHFTLGAAGSFSGSLALADARFSDGLGLEAERVDGRIEWTAGRISALVQRGHAGPLELGPLQLAWRADGRDALQVAGRAAAPLEETLSWLRDHPQLRQYVPEVRGLAARGAARFDFDFALPLERLSARRAQRLARARVAVLLDDATVMTGPGVPALQAISGAVNFDGGHLQRSLLIGRWLGGPVTLHLFERPERRAAAFVVKAQGLMDVRELAALGTVADPAALDGNAEWTGEFLLEPDSALHPLGQWQARLDASLTGVTSRLPEPLTKAAGVAAPLHVDIAGSSERAELHLALADRVHSVFEIAAAGEDAWRVERGSIRFGGNGPVMLASEPAVVLSGTLPRLESSPYLAAWNRAGHELLLPPLSGGIFVGELLKSGAIYSDAKLSVRPSAGALDLAIEPGVAAGPGS
jgi:uncharacterized protein YhdP